MDIKAQRRKISRSPPTDFFSRTVPRFTVNVLMMPRRKLLRSPILKYESKDLQNLGRIIEDLKKEIGMQN
ncbi:hypothetical protein MRB53_006268 [Persea americana]|uniref:Uncharacterized protein n=1 Tax=Persea americana TaxID=3435 RepID=A0ACC2MFU6_PERAE|nr:hypothetical protein MRB53_006268 [Persea americana]